MRYYKSFISKFNNYSLIYSIDKCVVVGEFEYSKIDYILNSIDKLYYKHLNKTADSLMSVPWIFDDLFYWSTNHYESKKNLSFYHNFSFEIKDGKTGDINSFWLGLGFNRFGNIDYTRWKLEFNPNKILPCDFVQSLFNILIVNSYTFTLKEFDIAVDFPMTRDMFSMSTNNGRKYSLILNDSLDKTEYSGVRHTNGFTKIYNKTLESKLDDDVTRIEFTFTDINYNDVINGLPYIFVTDFKQLKMGDIGILNDTESFILHTLLDFPERINELGRKMKNKMKSILNSYVYSYSISSEDFNKCIDILKTIDIVRVAL